MRCTSRGKSVVLSIDSTTAGPIVMFGTKWPSITSRWSRRAPPSVAAAIWSAKCAKSAERIDGARAGSSGHLTATGEDRAARGRSFEELATVLAPSRQRQGHEVACAHRVTGRGVLPHDGAGGDARGRLVPDGPRLEAGP